MADKQPKEALREILRFEKVGFRRNQKSILKNITFSIKGGEKWVILGPNGSGKTTMLSIATGYLFPTTGSVEIFGQQLGRFNIQKSRDIFGYLSSALSQKIPKHTRALDVIMTAKYGALDPIWNTYTKADKKRAMNLLKSVGCADLAEKEFQQCSSGERQRIMLVRTLMTDPKILLLDEPASGLDLGGREELIANLTELSSELPCVLVTHHTEEIPPNFTNLILLRGGEIVASGEIGSTLTPENLFKSFGQKFEIQHSGGRWASKAVS